MWGVQADVWIVGWGTRHTDWKNGACEKLGGSCGAPGRGRAAGAQ